jgi:diguanylate cyclase (GGDEF)-like protein
MPLFTQPSADGAPRPRRRRLLRLLATTWLTATLAIVDADSYAAGTSAGPETTRVTVDDVRVLHQMEDRGDPALRERLSSTVRRLDPNDAPTLIIDVFLAFAQMRYSDGASDTVIPSVERALELARAIGDEQRIAALDALAGEMQFAMVRSPESRRRIEGAITKLRTLGKPRDLARELAAYAMLLPDINEYALAMRLSNEAVRLVAFEPDPLSAVVFSVLYAQVEMLRLVGDADAALSSAKTLLARAERSINSEFIGFAQHSLARTLRNQGQKTRAAELLDSCFQRALASGNVWEQFISSIERVELALEMQSFADARKGIDRIAPLRDKIDDPLTRAQFDLFAASVLAHEGRKVEGRASFVKAKKQLDAYGEHPMHSYLATAESDVLASEGRLAEALNAMRKASALRIERDRVSNLKVLAAQADLHRLSEREMREAKLAQEARLNDARVEAVEQRLLNQRLTVAVAVLATVIAAMLAGWQVLRARRFRRRAEHDALTGALSRSAIEVKAATAFAFAKRTGQPLSLMIFDMDNLKWINDSFGHARGDLALKTVVRAISSVLKDDTPVARWGGDEFVVLLPNTPLAAAESLREQAEAEIRNALHRAEISNGSCSAGVASLGAQDATYEDILARADAALYAAKATSKRTAVAMSIAPTEREIESAVLLKKA